ncbi:hypothetical protein RND81_10G229800 [Saponaria officinalis]|uniref:Tf2-1-like SH3-like domain-containing protein n=1 Tax=Saponaria officinalis TaxID=3572 RepID=A0AAW1I5C9_SAPOF
MDFIDGLPKFMGMDSIMVVVDRLSKYAHFIPLKHPYSASVVAHAYFDYVYKLHEFWYNTLYHSSLKVTPFEVLYGQPPPLHLPYLPGESKVDSVDRTLLDREEALQLIRMNLARAQNRMKQQANKRRSDREFKVGDYVYLKLQPYRQQSVMYRGNQKLAKKYYGPYKILRRIGAVAYKLELPPGSKIHHTFHVSMLKLHHGPIPDTLPPVDIEGAREAEPELVLARKTVKRGRISVTKVLVKWKDSLLEDVT